MALHSDDQFNTTIYDYNDQYCGIKSKHHMLFINSTWQRAASKPRTCRISSALRWARAPGGDVRSRALSHPMHNLAAYFLEANVLVPLGSMAKVSILVHGGRASPTTVNKDQRT